MDGHVPRVPGLHVGRHRQVVVTRPEVAGEEVDPGLRRVLVDLAFGEDPVGSKLQSSCSAPRSCFMAYAMIMPSANGGMRQAVSCMKPGRTFGRAMPVRVRRSRSAASRRSFECADRGTHGPRPSSPRPGSPSAGSRPEKREVGGVERAQEAGIEKARHEAVERRTVERGLAQRLGLAGDALPAAPRRGTSAPPRARSRRAGRDVTVRVVLLVPGPGHREQQRAEEHVAGIGVAGDAGEVAGAAALPAWWRHQSPAARPMPCAGPRRRRAMRRRRQQHTSTSPRRGSRPTSR